MVKCTWQHKLFLFGLFSVFYAFFYILPNLFPLLPPRYLPLLEIDVSTPFLPWSFAIYLSEYVLVLLVIVLINDRDHFDSMSRMMFGLLFLSGLFFMFLPTTYPRPAYPEVENPIIAFLMGLVGSADKPNNCFPSMHVGITAIVVYACRPFRPWARAFFVLWGLLIILSTMTTKQHYFVDILGGLGVVVLVGVLEWAIFERRWLQSMVARTKVGAS